MLCCEVFAQWTSKLEVLYDYFETKKALTDIGFDSIGFY